MTAEQTRLLEARAGTTAWKQWGPYLSERQWGTVREDYSQDGNAWDYFSHDQARSRAYCWGEDGLAGISDDRQLLCFALAVWNGQDPILKERLFGLTNSEGNHGEDVKEYYYYLDSTPTHSYMRYLYKYPQAAYPYDELVNTNRRRSRTDPEYELIDTGIFDDSRYFDVFVTYAKAAAGDLLIEIEVANRGPEPASIHVLPTLWFRNTWAWGKDEDPRPTLALAEDAGRAYIAATHPKLGDYQLHLAEPAPLLFTENETNYARLAGRANRTPYVKDAFHRYVIAGDRTAVNPEQRGTKAAAHYVLTVAPGATQRIALRLSAAAQAPARFGADFDQVLAQRQTEADEFYAGVIPAGLDDDRRTVMRQALAGMLWTKQYYGYDVEAWLNGYGADPAFTKPGRVPTRNQAWFHMLNDAIVSMPDKWEYPWYAAWDLAFHSLPLMLVDMDFAKRQLELMLDPNYLHPNGQLPAYEWNFSDVNPPVHAWAVYYLYESDKARTGQGDAEFLKGCFHKLLLNFTWWVNRKDRNGSNVFEGGFLGLDNIGVFDRSSALPTGGYLEQADGTAWMAFYSLMMLSIAAELTTHDPVYEEMAIKFFEHFLRIAAAMDRIGDNADELWDEEDGFFYDVLRFDDGRSVRLKVRSMVGLLSLCASAVVRPEHREACPNLVARARWLNEHRHDLTANMPTLGRPGVEDRRLLATLNEQKLRRVLERMLDEQEFLSAYGIRALSRHHRDHPYVFYTGASSYRVDYEPAESSTGMFGGNSNWRGPIWFPVNLLLLRGLVVLYRYYGDAFTVECPTGSGMQMNLLQVADEIAERLTRIFLRDAHGRRPVFGDAPLFQTDPHWRDHLLFYEYFHGDNGAGIGANHQTGWTGLVALLIDIFEGADMTLAPRAVAARSGQE
jgi:hypothetical protein